MNRGDKLTLAAIIVIAACVPATFFSYVLSAKSMASYLELEGITVIKGEISSPSLILDVTLEEFLDLCEGRDVYRDAWSFYVFEPSMLVAYRYECSFFINLPPRN